MTDKKLIYQTAFIKKLEQLGIAYRCMEDNRLCFKYSGDKVKSVSYEVHFADSRVCLSAVELGSFTSATQARGFQLCSILNSELQWVKFVIDRRNKLLCQIDTVINADDAVEEIMELLERITTAIDEKIILLHAAQKQQVA